MTASATPSAAAARRAAEFEPHRGAVRRLVLRDEAEVVHPELRPVRDPELRFLVLPFASRRGGVGQGAAHRPRPAALLDPGLPAAEDPERPVPRPRRRGRLARARRLGRRQRQVAEPDATGRPALPSHRGGPPGHGAPCDAGGAAATAGAASAVVALIGGGPAVGRVRPSCFPIQNEVLPAPRCHAGPRLTPWNAEPICASNEDLEGGQRCPTTP